MKFFLMLMVLATSVVAEDKFKFGVRLQGILDNNNELETQDLYLRRMRLNVLYKINSEQKIVYDIRNDSANQADKGEKTFNIGDAYWQWKPTGASYAIKVYRGKVDVSYSQTSSSKHLFNPLRAEVAEYASDFIVHNRRAANVQINGSLSNLYYQFYVSDGVHSDDFEDASGKNVDSVIGQKLSYGTKLRYYFIGSAAENKVQDTFYGKHNTFSIGVGYGANDKIVYLNNTTYNQAQELRRSLINYEISFAHGPVRVLAEAFSFEGALADVSLSAATDTANASGYYAQAEYILFEKWAPYIGMESFDRYSDIDDAIYSTQFVGLNYYQNKQMNRFGIVYKKVEEGEGLSNSSFDAFSLYAMLDY
jgi:hypothetical protein